MTSVTHLRDFQSEIAQSRSLADDKPQVAGEARFNTKYPNFLRDLHQIPLTGNLFNTIVKTLRESPDNDFINRLLEEILQDRLLRQEIYNDPIAKFEINLLRNQGRLKNNFIESAINTPYEDDDEDGLGYEPDLLSLGNTNESIRSQAKKKLLEEINKETNDEVSDSFVQAITEVFELESDVIREDDEDDLDCPINPAIRDALKVILEDKELRELYKEKTISTWLNGTSLDYSAITGGDEEDGDDEFDTERTRMPLIKEQFFRDLYLKYFAEDLNTVFAKDPPAADFQAGDFVRACELIPAYSDLFKSLPQSKLHFEKFINSIDSIDSKSLLEWIEDDYEDDYDDEMKGVITIWFANASAEDKNKASAKLIRKGLSDNEEVNSTANIVRDWFKDASKNNNLLLKIIKNKSFPEFISNPFFVNILADNLNQKTKSGNHLFAHALVAYPDALKLAIDRGSIKENLVKCLDTKAQETGQTVKDYLLTKKKSYEIAKKYGIVA